MDFKQIKDLLPYAPPFLFVDEILAISPSGVTGQYRLREDEYFYKGHFVGHPVTPGVILTEIMAQIGVVCLGVYLLKEELANELPQLALSSSQVDYYLPVCPGETVKVVSEKEYFRFQKLKCKVQMFNEKNQLICRGTIAGMVARGKNS